MSRVSYRGSARSLLVAGLFVACLAAGSAPAAPHPPKAAPGRVIIAYVFPKDGLIDPAEIAADKLTHINYAFANLANGRVVEGFAKDAENFKVLVGLRRKHPHLKLLVSVGGWTWSKGFSDAALTARSRKVFVESARLSFTATTSTASTWTGNTPGWWETETCSAPRTRRNSPPSWPTFVRLSTSRARR